jgi:acetyltransferase-like isoleucine patch superfamily enzyme
MGVFLTRIRYFHYFLKFQSYGHNIAMSGGGVIVRPEEVQLGSNIFISRNFVISARDLRIGSDVMVGPNLVIECDDHRYDAIGVSMYENRANRAVGGAIVEDDVWIGANVTVLKGARISEGCVVGAGSVVIGRLPPYTVCVGVPCRPVKSRFDTRSLKEHLEKRGTRAHKSLDEVKDAWRSFGLI